MLLRTIFFASLLIFSIVINAQNQPRNIGARESAMGGAGVASTEFWASANNQASLGFNKQWGAGFYYENRFLTKELSLNSLSVVMPTKGGSFVLDMNYFGYSNYNESKIGFGYGMALSKRFALGVQIDYLRTAVGKGYGSSNIFTFEIGLLTKITDEISLGAHVFNPIQSKLNDYDNEKIPPLLKLGLQWELSENFVAAGEVQSDIDNSVCVIGGLEYRIMKTLYTRIGISNSPNIFSFGVGLQMKNFRFDFSSSMHHTLGYSPQLSLIYQANK